MMLTLIKLRRLMGAQRVLTHLDQMTGVGTPDCDRTPNANCTLPPPSSVPESAKHDELWIVKDAAKDTVLGAHGLRTWEAPDRTSLADAHAGGLAALLPALFLFLRGVVPHAIVLDACCIFTMIKPSSDGPV